MEVREGGGYVRCFDMAQGKPRHLGNVEWHRDGRQGREWRTETFDVPEDGGVIRLRITPFSGADFRVHELEVSAEFDSARAPSTALPEAGDGPTITGQVVLPDGREPAVDAKVWALLQWLDTRGKVPGMPLVGGAIYNTEMADDLTADADGVFAVRLRSPLGSPGLDVHPEQQVTVTVLAWSPDGSLGGMARTGALDPRVSPSEPVRIVLARTGSAEFNLLDPAGEAVTNASVKPMVRCFGGGAIAVPRTTVADLGGGRYRADHLIPGFEYRWWPDAPGHRFSHDDWDRHAPVAVTPGQHVDAPAVTLKWWDVRATAAASAFVTNACGGRLFDHHGFGLCRHC